MTILIKIIQFVLALSLLVIIHEMGHFIFAKLFKTRVEKFYLFFDPWFSLFKFRKGETEYGVGWLPLGGYVKISGMIDESLDKDQLNKPPQPYEFRAKPAWQRLLIMTGGVIFNFILALIIYTFTLYAWGETYLETSEVKYGIVTDSLGYEMGLRDGDRILTVDNEYVEDFYQILPDIILNERESIQVSRNGDIVDIPLYREYLPDMLKGKGKIDARVPFSPFVISGFTKESPAKSKGLVVEDEIIAVNGQDFEFYDEFQRHLADKKGEEVDVKLLRDNDTLIVPVTLTPEGMLGVTRAGIDVFELSVNRYGLAESVPAGLKKGFQTIGNYLKQFRVIFSKGSKGYEQLGGFLTIGSIFPGVWDWYQFWNLTALLSIMLGILNILPIPALDGGHVMFLLYEVVSGRKPSDRFLEYAQVTGMILLLSLLLYVNANDIVRFFFR